MSIKITDAFQLITDRKLLTKKALASLQRQITSLQSKIDKAQKKMDQVNWILKKNEELIVELTQLSEVQEEGAESFVKGDS